MEIYKLTKKIQCPKCKSKDLSLSQTFTSTISYSKEINEDYYLCMGETGQGENDEVFAKCHKCNKIWKLRGICAIYKILEVQDGD